MAFLFAGSSGADADSAISVLVEQIKGADAVGDQMELLTDAMVRLFLRETRSKGTVCLWNNS
jgi:hypothetical protein